MKDSAPAQSRGDAVRRSAPASAAVGLLAAGTSVAVAHLILPVVAPC